MDPAAMSIAEMYRLQGQEFEERWRIKAINIRRLLLEELVRDLFSNDNLDTQGRIWVTAQRQIAATANLTKSQEQDFATRLDDVVADAIVVIRRCLEDFPDRRSVEFQLEAARRLGVPVA